MWKQQQVVYHLLLGAFKSIQDDLLHENSYILRRTWKLLFSFEIFKAFFWLFDLTPSVGSTGAWTYNFSTPLSFWISVTDLPTRQPDLQVQECHLTRSTLRIIPLQGTHRVEVGVVLSNRLPTLLWGFSHPMEATLHHMLPLQGKKITSQAKTFQKLF